MIFLFIPLPSLILSQISVLDQLTPNKPEQTLKNENSPTLDSITTCKNYFKM